MAKFAYNNAKNSSIGHTSFELNYWYYPQMFYKENINPRCNSKSTDELSSELQEPMTVCQENSHHAQKL